MAGIKQFNEEQALDCAMAVFWQRGFASTSMQDLAHATGVLRGSLYNAYGDKQSIFLLAFERYRKKFLNGARSALAAPDAATALRAFFVFTIQSMTAAAPNAPTRGCLTTKIATDETAMADSVRQALRGMLDGLAEILEQRLAVPDALSRLTLTPPAAARLALTLTHGIVVMERVYREPTTLQAIADSLVTVLMA